MLNQNSKEQMRTGYHLLRHYLRLLLLLPDMNLVIVFDQFIECGILHTLSQKEFLSIYMYLVQKMMYFNNFLVHNILIKFATNGLNCFCLTLRLLLH